MTHPFISHIPKSCITTATKDLVDALLDPSINIGNRKIRPAHVRWLREQIEAGLYVLTNQGIGIDTSGALIDGQHRLMAVREAGYPEVPILVAYGLSREAKATIDTGLNRTMSDIFHFTFDHPEASATRIAMARLLGQSPPPRDRHTQQTTPTSNTRMVSTP